MRRLHGLHRGWCPGADYNGAALAGEIIPQAVCSRYGLQVGAYSAWFVRVLMVLCAVIAWPISKILDALLGQDHTASPSPCPKQCHASPCTVTVPPEASSVARWQVKRPM